MSYVDRNLMDGEHVAYRTRHHWVIYKLPILLALLGLAVCLAHWLWFAESSASDALLIAEGVVFLLALAAAIPPFVERRTCEFAVTNKRVIVKVGWVQRRSMETLLTKIEAIEVLQGVWARLLDYGTIVIIGTGGTKEPFERIAAPLEFRRKVQEQILALQTPR
jgi:membrane protein YdbS with pleckstrin-like domain